jgi:thioredoxin 1
MMRFIFYIIVMIVMAHIISSGEEFKTMVLSPDAGVVLVDFFAEWCGPCKMIAPILDELSTEYEGKAKIVKIDTDELGELAGQYEVFSIPTVLLFNNGELIGEPNVGAFPKEEYAKLLDSVL